MALLEVKNLSTEFRTKQGLLRAVRDLSFHVNSGEILGIVGESGSGKSVSMLSLVNLLGENGRVTAGELFFSGENISSAGMQRQALIKHEERMRRIRGREIAMVFQDPLTILNPVLKIGVQMVEGIRLHLGYDKRKAHLYAIDLLNKVGVTNAEYRMKQYPFELSGGIRQRIVVAIALSCKPKLLIADEPTTALDVTMKAQLLYLIRNCARESSTSVILITHDFSSVATICDRAAVLYAGTIVEEGTVEELFDAPCHPYTQGLFNSVADVERAGEDPLLPIAGSPPDLLKTLPGCAFAARCAQAMQICTEFPPEWISRSTTHRWRCWKDNMPGALRIAKSLVEVKDE